MIVGVVISIIIAIVVGVALVPVIVDSVSNISEDNSTPGAVNAVVGVLPYIFVVVLIIGAVAWIGGSDSGGKVPAQKVGSWVRDKWDGSVVTKPSVTKDIIQVKESGDAIREIPVIEVEVTPREKLGKDEVGWG